MRLIKMFLFVLVGLFAVLTIIGLFIPSSVKISRGIVIDADSAKLQQVVGNVQTWGHWFPWIKADSGALVQVSPEPNQPGSFFKWKSLNYKSDGIITIKTIQPNLVTVLYQMKDMNDSEGGFRLRPLSAQQTEVQWFMEYKLKWYPWERFYGIFLDKIIGPSFEQGLQNLKELTEKEQPQNT